MFPALVQWSEGENSTPFPEAGIWSNLYTWFRLNALKCVAIMGKGSREVPVHTLAHPCLALLTLFL